MRSQYTGPAINMRTQYPAAKMHAQHTQYPKPLPEWDSGSGLHGVLYSTIIPIRCCGYRAYSTARDSRITVTLIWPG
jgi:hypothetical protein